MVAYARISWGLTMKIILAALVSLIATAQGAYAADKSHSGIKGRAVLIAPCTGVESGPAQNHSFEIRDTKGRKITEFRTNTAGQFQVSLAPATYRISANDPQGTSACIWSGRKVAITKARYSTFKIVCHQINIYACVKP